MNQKLDSIRELEENTHEEGATEEAPVISIPTAPPIYLCVYFKTLKFLLVVNSGVICRVVKMNSFSIAAEP